MSRLPTFLLLSPQGAGGKPLAAGLRSLPGTYLPAQEIGFFSTQWDRGGHWYESWFRDADPGDVAVGEHSTSYVHPRGCEVVAARIDGFLEDVRLVAIVRHPAARAGEVFEHLRAAGRLDERDTLHGLLQAGPDHHGLRSDGRYSRWLHLFRKRFGDRLLVASVEQLAQDRSVVAQLLTHLGLPPELTDRLAGSVRWPPPPSLPVHSPAGFDDEVETLANTFGVDVTGAA